MAAGRTGDVVVEDVIFLDSIVDDLLGSVINHEDHPLKARRTLANQGPVESSRGLRNKTELLTSPPVVSWILERITGRGNQSLDRRTTSRQQRQRSLGVGLTVSLDLEDVDPHIGDGTSHGAEGRPTFLEAVEGIGTSIFVRLWAWS